MKDFSLFKHALNVAPKSREDWGKIPGLSRSDFDEHDSFVFRAKSPCLEYACLMIENALLLRTNRSGRVYVGFERFSAMQPVVERYIRIADISEAVYVFGEPDWHPPRHPNMRYLNLQTGSSLSGELFLVADCSNYSAALVAVDEDGLIGEKAKVRNFRIFKSTNPIIVTQLAAAVEGVIDLSFAA